MFNLIMISADWDTVTGTETIKTERIFEYTDEHISNQFTQDGNIMLDKLSLLPCLFMQEGRTDEIAYVGQINRPRVTGQEIAFEYILDAEVPPLTNGMIYANRMNLDMPYDFEFSRNHWAVKNLDLYRFLLRNVRPRRQRPKVFDIPEHENIEPSLVSVMMPFDANLNDAYQSIQQAANNLQLRCRRADEIWENPAIIQDVAALIDRARIVVCDCTGKNPNVFYEAGISHTLGRETILITQNEQDVPFDLRHLRYIPYLNNAEGLAELADKLQTKMQTILGH